MVMHKIQSSFFTSMDENFNKTEEEKDSITYKSKTIKDVNRIKNKNSKNKYNRASVMADLMYLKQYSKQPVQMLKKEALDKFYEMIKINEMLKKDENLRDTFLKDVKKVFSNLENVKPGTVEAIFMDCSQKVECDPTCEESIFKNENEKQCDQIILYFLTEENNFKPVNNIQKSNNCYIYIDALKKQFKGFSKENLSFLKQNYQCQGYVLLFTDFNKNKNYDSIPFSQLPLQSNAIQQNPSQKDMVVQEQPVDINSVFVVLLVLLFILIVVAVIFYSYQDHSGLNFEF